MASRVEILQKIERSWENISPIETVKNIFFLKKKHHQVVDSGTFWDLLVISFLYRILKTVNTYEIILAIYAEYLLHRF